MYISLIEIFSSQKNIHFRIVSDFKKLFQIIFYIIIYLLFEQFYVICLHLEIL